MLLQTVVFIQPLLPAQFRIALVCVTISDVLADHAVQSHHAHSVSGNSHQSPLIARQQPHATQTPHQHDDGHTCPYCTVFAHLTTGLDLSMEVVLDRLYVRLLAFERAFRHVYFALQRLYLFPQGRAPPFFA